MKNRILTIQIEIVDHKEAAWIWDNHMNNTSCHGVHVSVILSGPISRQFERENEDEEEENDL